MIKFHIITIFPEAFQSYFNNSLLKKAQDKGLIKIDFINPRDFTADKHHKVDEKPFGGGPGMVMQIEPIYKALQSVKKKNQTPKSRVILFSVKGKKFDQKMAKRFSKLDQVIMICGRYEGVDERVAKYIADEEVSVGEYILTGGEIPAMVVVDAVSRFIPGVLGKYESLEEIKGSYPVYTRPECVIIKGKKRAVPKVLLSGNHKKIEEWRKK
ncbi:MAG TPA: tRNA (guanosine(37)-N1)-methyltransferase TrmD [Candidatus Paceibacterota bacterium]|nr:tRNA (guanosine(37)-N1)-methyltransferase TrmD [Candidatus Paceibacterota bacterium]